MVDGLILYRCGEVSVHVAMAPVEIGTHTKQSFEILSLEKENELA